MFVLPATVFESSLVRSCTGPTVDFIAYFVTFFSAITITRLYFLHTLVNCSPLLDSFVGPGHTLAMSASRPTPVHPRSIVMHIYLFLLSSTSAHSILLRFSCFAISFGRFSRHAELVLLSFISCLPCSPIYPVCERQIVSEHRMLIAGLNCNSQPYFFHIIMYRAVFAAKGLQQAVTFQGSFTVIVSIICIRNRRLLCPLCYRIKILFHLVVGLLLNILILL